MTIENERQYANANVNNVTLSSNSKKEGGSSEIIQIKEVNEELNLILEGQSQ